MSDAIGTYREGLWLERIESAIYEVLIGAICARDYDAACQWVGLLERLSIV